MHRGFAFGLLLSTRVSWALGRLPTNLLLRGLPLRLLWLRNHLVYDLLHCSCYTYAHAYDMRNAGMIYKNYKQPIPEIVFIYLHQLTLTNPSQPLPHRSDRSTRPTRPVRPVPVKSTLPPVRPVLPRPQTVMQVAAKLAHKFQILSRP